MLPWFTSTVYHLGPLTLQTWGTIVAAGMLFATWLSARRANARGLRADLIWDMAFWMFIAGFLGARVFHVFLYEPGYYLAHPFEALDLRQPGYALMGGVLGGALAFWLFVRKHALNFLEYADVVMWGVPWGCGIGRIGCFLIHDHPGTLTSFVLGVKFPDGNVRHDLGLYLSLFGFALGVVFVLMDRKRRHAGFYLGWFLVLDGAGRFLLDFLRIDDRRLIGLTPTQWVLIVTVALGGMLIAKTATRSTQVSS